MEHPKVSAYARAHDDPQETSFPVQFGTFSTSHRYYPVIQKEKKTTGRDDYETNFPSHRYYPVIRGREKKIAGKFLKKQHSSEELSV